MKKINTLIGLSLISSVTFAQTFNKAKMDSLMTALENNNKAMGSICITKDGKEEYSRAIGYIAINGQDKKHADTHSKYRIGSISKMFTATLIFQLIDEKKLSLDTKLNKFFQQIPNADKITIAQLLGHRSGIHNFTDDDAYGGYMGQPKTQREMLDIITKAGSDFEPDSKAGLQQFQFCFTGLYCREGKRQALCRNVAKENSCQSRIKRHLLWFQNLCG